MEALSKTWAFACQKCPEHPVLKSMQHLKGHYLAQHQLVYWYAYCFNSLLISPLVSELCLEFRKEFLADQRLYTNAELNEHMRLGEPAARMKPHPPCGFCSKPFYDDESLFYHCTSAHESCFVCDRLGLRHQVCFPPTPLSLLALSHLISISTSATTTTLRSTLGPSTTSVRSRTVGR